MASDSVRDPETVLAQGVQAAVAQYMAGGIIPAPTMGEVWAVGMLERIAAGKVPLRDTRRAAVETLDLVANWRQGKGGGDE